jgi:gliding motility-associated-like protein
MQLIIHPAFQFTDTLCALEHYYWPANNLQLIQSGTYFFNHYSTEGCDSIENLVLMIVYQGEVFLPNVFSPNGDQINDKFFVNANEDVHSIDLFAIYDRWGELMFRIKDILPNDPQYGWDGNFRNAPLNPAVFVYLVEWRDKFGGRHKAIGDVTLAR